MMVTSHRFSRVFFQVFFLATLALSFTANQAHASLFDKVIAWFKPPMELEGPRPDETLQAPFVNQSEQSEGALEQIYDGAKSTAMSADGQVQDLTNLSVPHRNQEQIDKWATNAVATAFNFTITELRTFGKILRPYYTNDGMEDFRLYLSQSGIVSDLQKAQARASAYVRGQPTLVQKGQDEGLYVWIVDVPLTISYLPLNAQGQDRIKSVFDKDMTIRVKIERVGETDRYPEGMAISRLNVTDTQ